MRLRRAVALAIALLCLGAGPAVAVAACPQTSVADIEDEVMCPVCGTSLAVAGEAPQAQRERAFILRRVEACASKQEIKVALADEYGEDVLAVPDADGFDLAAYLVPALALLGALTAVGVAARRWRRARHASSPGPASPSGPSRAHADGSAGASPSPAPDAAGRRLQADLERYDL